MTRGTFGPGTIVLGGASVVLVAFLVVGFLLPGTWEAAAERRIAAPASELTPYLDSPEGWRAWTTWPDSGLTRTGPERGAGAALRWDDRELGAGSFRIDGVGSEGGVTYSVEVEGAGNTVMRTTGSVTLRSDGEGTLVLWREQGDLGGNPLMGYWALAMADAQSAEMEKGLERLAELVRGADPPDPH